MIRLACLALLATVAACDATHGGIAAACHGLALGDCRLTAGCKPDACAGCGCAESYRGCLAEIETPATCPALGCPSGICCSSAEACVPATGDCTPPGSAPGCGACNTDPGTCTTDATCQAGGASMICEPIACSCSGNQACVQGCVDDTTCAVGTRCDVATARCVAKACTDAMGCPANFDCTSQMCARRTCTEDLACDGFCVWYQCFAERGECRLATP